jgi:hypothetical protein
MQEFVVGMRVGLSELQSEARERLRSNRVAMNREFAFVLHSASRLRHAFGETVMSPRPAVRDSHG